MRGKASFDPEFAKSLGITPAYAGKRQGHSLYKTNRKDHPRVCGEKHVFELARFVVVRITPAYAGKSFSSMFICFLVKDHPRVCGEKHFQQLFLSA